MHRITGVEAALVALQRARDATCWNRWMNRASNFYQAALDVAPYWTRCRRAPPLSPQAAGDAPGHSVATAARALSGAVGATSPVLRGRRGRRRLSSRRDSGGSSRRDSSGAPSSFGTDLDDSSSDGGEGAPRAEVTPAELLDVRAPAPLVPPTAASMRTRRAHAARPLCAQSNRREVVEGLVPQLQPVPSEALLAADDGASEPSLGSHPSEGFYATDLDDYDSGAGSGAASAVAEGPQQQRNRATPSPAAPPPEPPPPLPEAASAEAEASEAQRELLARLASEAAARTAASMSVPVDDTAADIIARARRHSMLAGTAGAAPPGER